MEKLLRGYLKIACITIMLAFLSPNKSEAQAQAQTTPVTFENLNSFPVKDQLNYINSNTKIYDRYRAIREDVFQRFSRGVLDSISKSGLKIKNLNEANGNLKRTIDSLHTSLDSTRVKLNDITKTKESMNLLGMQVNKATYNKVVFVIIIGLLAILLIVLLVLKRNQTLVNHRKKDLEDLRSEFEAYRKSSREAREKMALQHFNELKKLRGEA